MTELVVLLGPDGSAVGTADKAVVHHTDTPLHLAFSCYVFDRDGRFLLTRRAATKRTFAGVWTNSCCGHPGPEEPLADAVRRRLADELGIAIEPPRLVLPAFAYRAVAADGVVENELCPVFVATTAQDPSPDPAEVDDWAWVDWADFRADVLAGRRPISEWCRAQVAALPEDPLAAGARPDSELPPAARL